MQKNTCVQAGAYDVRGTVFASSSTRGFVLPKDLRSEELNKISFKKGSVLLVVPRLFFVDFEVAYWRVRPSGRSLRTLFLLLTPVMLSLRFLLSLEFGATLTATVFRLV